MPKVSIITASYNYENYIPEAIESVINQTYQDWEMLVVDDGSKDNSVDVINKYVQKDSRVKLLTHPGKENKGLFESLKLGISKSNGDYIVFLESDDYIKQDYIEKKLSVFEKNDSVGLIYNKVHTFGYELPQKYYKWLERIDKYWTKHNYPHNIHQQFAIENFIPTFSCVMIKKDLLQNIAWCSPNPAWTDYWIWIQVSKKCDIYYCPEELSFWRMHKDSYLNNAKKNPQLGYEFYKTMLFNNPVKITRLDYYLRFLYLKTIRFLYYMYKMKTSRK